jgi:hypothetical protein
LESLLFEHSSFLQDKPFYLPLFFHTKIINGKVGFKHNFRTFTLLVFFVNLRNNGVFRKNRIYILVAVEFEKLVKDEGNAHQRNGKRE